MRQAKMAKQARQSQQQQPAGFQDMSQIDPNAMMQWFQMMSQMQQQP